MTSLEDFQPLHNELQENDSVFVTNSQYFGSILILFAYLMAVNAKYVEAENQSTSVA